jgi:hypothetical protein
MTDSTNSQSGNPYHYPPVRFLWRHSWMFLGTRFYCEKCGETSVDTVPPQMGCPVKEMSA